MVEVIKKWLPLTTISDSNISDFNQKITCKTALFTVKPLSVGDFTICNSNGDENKIMNLTQQKSQRPFIQNAKHVSSQSQDLSQAQNIRINFQPLINLNKARNIS